jgi:hypothetical protein
MLSLFLAALLGSLPLIARADEFDEVQPCVFEAHTTVGTVSGVCATQQLPAPGFNWRWKLTLTFDDRTAATARQLRPDRFYDIMRAQSAEDGTDIIVLPLWGDLRVLPTVEEYRDDISSTAPVYECRPTVITISQTSDSPFTLELLFEERQDDFNLVSRMPSAEWWGEYLQCYFRLGTNRPDGFSIADEVLIRHRPPGGK